MLNRLKALYLRSPGGLQRAYAAVPYAWRLGAPYRRTRRLLEASERWSAGQLRALQDERVRELVAFAHEHVPYYRRTMDRLGLSPADFAGVDDLPKLPLLAKDDVRRHADDLRARCVPPRRTHFATTAGSTGEPLGLHFHNDCYGTEWAFMLDQWRRVGFRPGDRKATFRGRHFEVRPDRFHRDNPVYHERCFSIYHLTREALPHYLAAFRAFRPRFVHGYPSAVARFAQLVREAGADLPPLQAVLCGSEQIFPHQRELIGEVLGCRVYSWYGQTEKVILAGECEHGARYHCYPQYGVTEIVRPDGAPCAPGEVGELVGTGFMNRAMPLIRYRMGDRAAWGEGDCACGRQYPMIDKLAGREQDHVVTQSGRLIPITGMLFGAHMDEYTQMEKVQLEQREPGAAILRVVQAAGATAEELEQIRRGFEAICDGECRFTIERVAEIPPTEGGKYRYMIQHLDVRAHTEPPQPAPAETSQQ
ncbi:MAG: phenylacetate--CoA ligase family protein [Candidatus Brocadiaceae bacterium]|nr:phenylacetate--CoA ligase family protein [Candidatus Brocadiaceae bacterium]